MKWRDVEIISSVPWKASDPFRVTLSLVTLREKGLRV